MIDGERRCMDFGVYLKRGWLLDKSFTVAEYEGVLKKKESK